MLVCKVLSILFLTLEPLLWSNAVAIFKLDSSHVIVIVISIHHHHHHQKVQE